MDSGQWEWAAVAAVGDVERQRRGSSWRMCCAVAVLALLVNLQRVMWQLMYGPICRLVHGGRSCCEAAVTKGGDSAGDGGGGRRVFGFGFGYENRGVGVSTDLYELNGLCSGEVQILKEYDTHQKSDYFKICDERMGRKYF